MGIKSNHPAAYYFNVFGASGKGAMPPLPFSATGGNVNGLEPGNGYKYHTFTSPGNFVVTDSGDTVESVT